jgi:hypothetical protein
MRSNVLQTIIVSASVSAAVAAAMVVCIRGGSGLSPAAAKADAPAVPAQVDAAQLQKLVHDEVDRQITERIAQARDSRRDQPTRQVNSVEAKLQSVRSTLYTLRSQLVLYRLQHNDDFPTLAQVANGFQQLTARTNGKGEVIAAGQSFGLAAYGPYLQVAPANAVTGHTKVAAAGKATADAGWTYDPATGMIKAVLPRQLAKQADTGLHGEVEFVGAGD